MSRREILIAGGAALTGGVLGATGVHLLAPRDRSGSGVARPGAPVSVEAWVAARRAPYFIGHRGAGGVAPEHTLPSYLQALEWGAECIEVSVVRSADDVLFCLHDLTLDRTTTLKGEARRRSSAELDTARVSIPGLGPAWSGQNMPPLPRLATVLQEIGPRAVLCIEPKDDGAYDSLVAAIREHELQDSVILKLDHTSGRIAQAHDGGFPVFAYLGNAEVVTEAAIEKLARTLDPLRDVMVLPARADADLMPPALISSAVSTGIPVWVFPIHRRHEVTYFANLGVEGMIAASVGYAQGAIPPAKADNWASGRLSPGELTRNPYARTFDLDWSEPATATLPTDGRQAFVTLGQFCPLEAPSYRIAFDACFDPLPSDTWQHLSISFARQDDRYYEHRLGEGDGYHALLRADGTMGLYAHVNGDPNGQELAPARQSTPLKSGLWSRLTLDVTPEGLRWSRDDGTAVEARDPRFRGGYFHLGSSANDGALRVRALGVS